MITQQKKLTLIWSYSYDPRSGNEVAPFGDAKCERQWENTVEKFDDVGKVHAVVDDDLAVVLDEGESYK